MSICVLGAVKCRALEVDLCALEHFVFGSTVRLLLNEAMTFPKKEMSHISNLICREI
jgi:hypothetical protein